MKKIVIQGLGVCWSGHDDFLCGCKKKNKYLYNVMGIEKIQSRV